MPRRTASPTHRLGTVCAWAFAMASMTRALVSSPPRLRRPVRLDHPLPPGRCSQHAKDPIHRLAFAGGDVGHDRNLPLSRQSVCSSHVPHVNPVPRLIAVAVDDEGRPEVDVIQRPGHQRILPDSLLPWPVDVPVPQDGYAHASARYGSQPDGVLASPFAGPPGALGPFRVVL